MGGGCKICRLFDKWLGLARHVRPRIDTCGLVNSRKIRFVPDSDSKQSSSHLLSLATRVASWFQPQRLMREATRV